MGVAEQIKELFDADRVNSYESRGRVVVEVCRDSSITLTFDHLLKLRDIIGAEFDFAPTKEFNIEHYKSRGCETCDHGAEYSITFSFVK